MACFLVYNKKLDIKFVSKTSSDDFNLIGDYIDISKFTPDELDEIRSTWVIGPSLIWRARLSDGFKIVSASA